MSALRRGYLTGTAAYALWGLFPLYWKLLQDVGPIEILAHRAIWSCAAVAVILLALRRWTTVLAIVRQPKLLAGVTVATVLIAINWGTYVYGVNSGQVVEASLGYFINPLVGVALGVLVLGERLRGAQWAAVGVGAAAVVVLTVDHGRLPWIALTLGFSFGLYGLVKKRLGLPAMDGLLVESAVLTPVAIAFLSWQSVHSAGGNDTPTTLLLILGGPITAIPLVLFADAANRIPLSALGLLQYLAPVIQFGIGVLVYREPMPPARIAGFALVWLALAIFSWDAIRAHGTATVAPTGETVAEPS